jgi:DNA repair exonuclease SbcCD ATPase subunit
MNIRFNNITIENFRSIETAYVELEHQGTVIVKGINEYEDKATSNGSGKSSIFEAIIFALFEETSSGEKDVANRLVNNGYNIILKFEVDIDKYTIVRQCKSNKTSVIMIWIYLQEIKQIQIS